MIDCDNEKFYLEICPINCKEIQIYADKLQEVVGDSVSIELSEKKISEDQKRSIDSSTVLQIIGITFAGIELVLKISKFFIDMAKKDRTDVLIINNPKNDKAIIINAIDSQEKVHENIKKIL